MFSVWISFCFVCLSWAHYTERNRGKIKSNLYGLTQFLWCSLFLCAAKSKEVKKKQIKLFLFSHLLPWILSFSISPTLMCNRMYAPLQMFRTWIKARTLARTVNVHGFVKYSIQFVQASSVPYANHLEKCKKYCASQIN